MTNENSLEISTGRNSFPTSSEISAMSIFAQTLLKTNQLPATINTAEKLVMVFQAGKELGIPPIESINSMYFVNNRLSLFGSVVMRRIREIANCKIIYHEWSETVADVEIQRPDGTNMRNKLTMAELEKRGITSSFGKKKDTYLKHGKQMLVYRCVGEMVKHIAPEAIGSLQIKEVEEVDFDETETEKKPQRKGKHKKTEIIDPENEFIDITDTADTDQENDQDLPEFGDEIDEIPIPTFEEVNKSYKTQQLKNILIEQYGIDTELDKFKEKIKTKADAIKLYISLLDETYNESDYE